MNVRVKLSESSETEKKLQHACCTASACLLYCCSNVKVWLNEGVAQSSYAPPTHTVMVPHGLCGEKSISFSPLLRSLGHIY